MGVDDNEVTAKVAELSDAAGAWLFLTCDAELRGEASAVASLVSLAERARFRGSARVDQLDSDLIRAALTLLEEVERCAWGVLIADARDRGDRDGHAAVVSLLRRRIAAS